MFIDDLPLFGMWFYRILIFISAGLKIRSTNNVFKITGVVGEADENKNEYYIYTHMKFDMGYNGNRIGNCFIAMYTFSEHCKKLN